MKFLCIFLLFGLVEAMIRVGPGRENPQQIVQRQMNALDLVANSRDRNGFNRIMGAAEAGRWGSPDNFFNRYQNRHITTHEAHYESNYNRVIGEIEVSGNGRDHGFASQVRMSLNSNGHQGWKITGIVNHPGVNRGK